MAVKISELQPGDELLCFMRTGLALAVGRTSKGLEYRYVPKKPRRARSRDFTRFLATVLSNDPATTVITLRVAKVGSDLTLMASPGSVDGPAEACISYSSFSRVRRLSKTHTDPRPMYTSRPTSTEGLGTQPHAFRTLEEVDLR